MFFFFFFQAEDGIRDGRVTGVQTCALPIYHREAAGHGGAAGGNRASRADGRLVIDRKSVVEGKSGDLGGRRSIKKKKKKMINKKKEQKKKKKTNTTTKIQNNQI